MQCIILPQSQKLSGRAATLMLLTAHIAHDLMQQHPNPAMITTESIHDIDESGAGEAQLRDLISFTAGGKTLAVFADDVEVTAEGCARAPLPRAPAVILGVVCVRGRMMTVLDPAGIVEAQAVEWPRELPYVVALRGDEQLALAAESLREPITIAETDIDRTGNNGTDPAPRAVVGIARYGGEEIAVLDSRSLFSAAFQRRERRRRRF